MHKIFKCPKCREYTLEEKCSKCKIKTTSTKPPKFSLDDKKGEWRRKYKNELEIKNH